MSENNFVILGDMYLYTVRLTDVVDCLPRKSCTVTDAKVHFPVEPDGVGTL